jgi:hypothetical protein
MTKLLFRIVLTPALLYGCFLCLAEVVLAHARGYTILAAVLCATLVALWEKPVADLAPDPQNSQLRALRRRRWRRLALGSAVLLGCLYSGCAACNAGLEYGMCREETVADARSPAGAYEARAFVRDCGATTLPASFVSLSDRRWWLAWRGTDVVYIVDGCPEAMSLQWDQNQRLLVGTGAHGAGPNADRFCKVYRTDDHWRDVEIQYVQPSDAGNLR